MKVGTDGVLLGAWAELHGTGAEIHGAEADLRGAGAELVETGAEPENPVTTPAAASSVAERISVLDVGTGCGLVALMLAQRFPDAAITALEIDDEAANQARENVQRSPFAEQINVVTADFLHYNAQTFDAIVSNPPFFEEDLLPPDAKRANARHTAAGLNFETLVTHSAKLLCAGGSLQVIIPKTAQTRFHTLCNLHDLVLLRATDVRTVQRKAPKRVLLYFVKGSNHSSTPTCRDELVLMDSGNRSEAYTHLCRDFYL